MTFTESINSCISHATKFKGRAPRSEFWFFVLFNYIVNFIIYFVFSITGYFVAGYNGSLIAYGVATVLCALLFFLPWLSVLVRRLHDSGHSGWWFWISAIPLVGGIWLFVLLCQGSDEENEYGLPVY